MKNGFRTVNGCLKTGKIEKAAWNQLESCLQAKSRINPKRSG